MTQMAYTIVDFRQTEMIPVWTDTDQGARVVESIDFEGCRYVHLQQSGFEPRSDIWPEGRWFTLPDGDVLKLKPHERQIFFYEGQEFGSPWVCTTLLMAGIEFLMSERRIALRPLFENGFAYLQLDDCHRLVNYADMARLKRWKSFLSLMVKVWEEEKGRIEKPTAE